MAKEPNLAFPDFDSDDRDGWISKTEKYFIWYMFQIHISQSGGC